jgi:propionyl-CoA synthetase
MTSYAEAYQHSLEDPDSFWADAASQIRWIHKPSVILDGSRSPLYQWFSDGTLNT